MTTMLPGHYDPSNPSGLLYDPNSGHALGHGIPHRVENLNQKPKLIFKMPRVVPDQKNKFENDDLFRRLVRESEVKYTGYRDRPADERRQHFQKSLRSGVLEIAIVSNGTNINLCFSAPGSNNYNNNNNNNNNNSTTKELDLDKEPGKAHIRSSFILNGVCVRWRGWLDLERLDGLGVVEYDDDSAQEEERIFREEIERHKLRLRELDDKQRSFRQPQTSTPGSNPSNATAAAAAAAAAAALHHHHQMQHHQYHNHSSHGTETSNIQVR